MTEEIGAHIIVCGRVQGVGFRAFVQLEATKLQLHGWVRNCSDGSVESQVEGPRDQIERFLEKLHQGPTCSRVNSVKVDWKEANRQTEGFKILR